MRLIIIIIIIISLERCWGLGSEKLVALAEDTHSSASSFLTVAWCSLLSPIYSVEFRLPSCLCPSPPPQDAVKTHSNQRFSFAPWWELREYSSHGFPFTEPSSCDSLPVAAGSPLRPWVQLILTLLLLLILSSCSPFVAAGRWPKTRRDYSRLHHACCLRPDRDGLIASSWALFGLIPFFSTWAWLGLTQGPLTELTRWRRVAVGVRPTGSELSRVHRSPGSCFWVNIAIILSSAPRSVTKWTDYSYSLAQVRSRSSVWTTAKWRTTSRLPRPPRSSCSRHQFAESGCTAPTPRSSRRLPVPASGSSSDQPTGTFRRWPPTPTRQLNGSTRTSSLSTPPVTSPSSPSGTRSVRVFT